MPRNDVPQKVIVVGAGAVGLSCAWSLQQLGVYVEVLDRRSPGMGASWGNAGYITPALAVPLPGPALLRYGLRAVLTRNSPVHFPWHADASRISFMARMIRNCTKGRWQRGMSVFRQLNGRALDAFDAQRDGGVAVIPRECSVLAGFETSAQALGLLHELQAITESGQEVHIDLLTADQVHEIEPALSPRVRSAVKIRHQRYVDPIAYVASLADQVRERGGKLTDSADVKSVNRRGNRVVVAGVHEERDADAVILATGAWLPLLARPHGVRVRMYSGRGYSFSVPGTTPLSQPVYFPAQRVALTPKGDRIKLAGIMEFQRPDAQLNPRRVTAMTAATKELLDGVDWTAREDLWVGPRPLTADGIPVVGRSRTLGVFIAGGHGMWGLTFGPLTGQLLAEEIVRGRTRDDTRALDPCRA